MTRPAPIVRCPTSELPITPGSRPTAAPDASIAVWAQVALSRSITGVRAIRIALASGASRKPHPSKMINAAIGGLLIMRLSQPEIWNPAGVFRRLEFTRLTRGQSRGNLGLAASGELKLQRRPGHEVHRRRSESQHLLVPAIEEVLNANVELLRSDALPLKTGRVIDREVEAMVGGIIQDRAERRYVVAIADENIDEVRADGVIGQQQLVDCVMQSGGRGIFRRAQRNRARIYRAMGFVQISEIAVERQPMPRREAGNKLNALRIDPSGISGNRSELAGRADHAGNRHNQVVDAPGEIDHADVGRFAEVFGDSAVILAGNLGAEIRIAEAGEVEFVETGGAAALAVTAAQARSITLKRHHHRPCRTDLFAEVAVAVHSETAG